MNRVREGDGTDRWTAARWRLVIESPAPGVFLERFHGYATSEVADLILKRLEPQVRREKFVTCFCDWEEATGYEGSVRERLTAWNLSHKDEIYTHALVRSPLLSMALSVGSLVVGGGIRTYVDRRAFESELHGAVRRERAALGA